jgi:RNA polymerase sigma factor (TIGR02999 family)
MICVVADPSLEHLIATNETGTPEAQQALFAALYTELKAMARRELHRQRGLTLGANTLLHETYLKLGKRAGLTFPNRAQFLGYASRAMRGLVIDYARRRQAQKRGGEFHLTELPTDVPQAADASELQRLGDAIDELASLQPELAQLVDLKYFCGYSVAEIASIRDVSERTVMRDWEKARIVLHRLLSDS